MNNKPPIYKNIAEDLRKTLANGHLKPGMLLCTEKSLSQKYNVSRITSKHAIEILEKEGLIYRKRGSGSFVSDEPADGKIHINRIPRNVALVIPFNITKGGLYKAIETAIDVLADNNYYFSLHVSDNETETLSGVQNIDISGLVYYPMYEVESKALDAFVRRGIPVIILDKPHNYSWYSNIVCDNHYGEALLTEHLLAYGHTKTAYLSRYTEKRSSIHERFNGYVDALQQSGLNALPRFVKVDSDALRNTNLLRHILIKLYKDGFTAFLCENDEVAFHALMCCRGLGVRVPEEISIVGFDNIEWSVTGGADITTVDQDFELMGAALANLITAKGYAPAKICVPVRFIPRSSTGPAPR
ncbi:MAG: LacI family transcriptional regulator [Clostridiales bacterium]|jgi:DNA-binding LacI/PurR family transcriptional regulator|nr:LacI family transcriptional regulator [Clostridiales bacterium]